MDPVIEALEVPADSTSSPYSNKASLWDLFELNSSNGGWGKYSDRGAVLLRLNAKTLKHLREWLEENKVEAASRYGPNLVHRLWTEVCILGNLRAMSNEINEPDNTQDGSGTLPLDAVGYTRSGRRVDLMIPIKLELLRQEPRHTSQRDWARELGVPRGTLRDILTRMKEIEFTLDNFNTDELAYIMVGDVRGRRKASTDFL